MTMTTASHQLRHNVHAASISYLLLLLLLLMTMAKAQELAEDAGARDGGALGEIANSSMAEITTGSVSGIYAGSGGACRLKHKHDPMNSPYKQVYTVAVLAFRGEEKAWDGYNATFNDYLTATAGQMFDPPIQFVMKPVFQTLFEDVAMGAVDFVYVNPGQYSCIESEYEAYSLVSQVSQRNINGNVYNLKKFGGVIMTRSDRDDINSIYDLKDKIVATASITGLGSGQMQFLQMQQVGMDYLHDPKQLVFTRNQNNIVNGVLSGEFDVGFVRTDQMERSVDGDGNLLNISNFKVIDPQESLSIDGVPFPFESSTVSTFHRRFRDCGRVTSITHPLSLSFFVSSHATAVVPGMEYRCFVTFT